MTARINMHENIAVITFDPATLAELPSEAYRQTKLTMRKMNLDAMYVYLDE